MPGLETYAKNEGLTEKERELMRKGFTKKEILEARKKEEEMAEESKKWQEEEQESKENDPFWKEMKMWGDKEAEEEADFLKERMISNFNGKIKKERNRSALAKIKRLLSRIIGMEQDEMPESADPSDENAPYDIISAGTSVNMVGKDGSVDAAIIQEFDHDADKIILRYENGGMGVLKERHIKNVYKKDGKYFLVL